MSGASPGSTVGSPAGSTATTWAARDHARAQEGAVVTSMPTVPATAAVDLPPGVAAPDVVWDERLGSGAYATRVLARGTRLRLADVDGDACAHLLVLDAAQPSERLNVADTVKVQWQAYLGRGAALLSGMGRVLASVLEDTAGRHDALFGTSTRAANAARYGDGAVEGPAPNGRDRFLQALAKHGLGPRDLPPTISFFKGVRVEADGGLTWQGDPAAPAHVVLRADADLVVAVANVAHPLDPRPEYTVSPLRVTAWRGEPAAADDAVRTSTPEVRRAFENADERLRAWGRA